MSEDTLTPRQRAMRNILLRALSEDRDWYEDLVKSIIPREGYADTQRDADCQALFQVSYYEEEDTTDDA